MLEVQHGGLKQIPDVKGGLHVAYDATTRPRVSPSIRVRIKGPASAKGKVLVVKVA